MTVDDMEVVMGRNLVIAAGMLGTVLMMVGALWLWQSADELAMSWSRRLVGLWAARSLSVAVGAAGQVLLLTMVVGQLSFGEPASQPVAGRSGAGWEAAAKLGAALVCVISLVSAVALGLAGR